MRALVLRLALLLSVTASPRALPAQAAADTTPILRSWRRTPPYRRGVVIWVANQGQESVRIRAVTVNRCLNIGAGCGTTPLSLLLAPGDSATALIIRPRLWGDRYVYTLSWEWETGAAAAPAP